VGRNKRNRLHIRWGGILKKGLMKQITIFLFAIFFIGFSCNTNNSSDNSNKSQIDSIVKNPRIYPPDTVVLNFLIWYRDNFEKMHPFYTISDKNDSSMISGKWGDSTTYFSVNFKGTEKFLKFLSSSNCLSKKYLDNKRKYIKERAIELLKYKQWDGPPIGFSAEEIFYMNDIEDYFRLIQKAKIIDLVIKGNTATCKVDFFERKLFRLSTYNNRWLIDDIEFFDYEQ